ncbi:MAG: dihydrodipicolinate reductase C-terminal domain-containing protein [Pyrinomonadaceae bacterium]
MPLVEGTTGWQDRRTAIEQVVREGNGAIIFGANFSIGVNLFYRIADFTAELFSKFPEYEAFIEERHHSRKKDAPSGTALKLKEVVSRHIERDFTVAATRAGNIPGTHTVGFRRSGGPDHAHSHGSNPRRLRLRLDPCRRVDRRKERIL